MNCILKLKTEGLILNNNDKAMDELSFQKESKKIALTNNSLEQKLLTLAEVIKPLPKILKELQLETKGKKPEQNPVSNPRLDELNTILSQLVPSYNAEVKYI